MPLSEHEQRLLEQMERALHAEDPKLASTLRHGSDRTVNGRQVFLGSLGVLVGIAALLGGVITSLIVLGVVGFLIMLGGALMIGAAFRAPRPVQAGGGVGNGAQQTAPKAKKSSGGFMDRVEERWRRRREEDGFSN